MAKIKIEGLKELKKELKKLSDREVKNITTSALRAGASTISKTMKSNVPSDTGDLRRSVGIKKSRTPKTFIKFSIGPQANKTITQNKQKRTVNQADYAFNVEYGTQFQQAQPYARKTFDNLDKRVTDAITTKMAQRIEKASNKK